MKILLETIDPVRKAERILAKKQRVANRVAKEQTEDRAPLPESNKKLVGRPSQCVAKQAARPIPATHRNARAIAAEVKHRVNVRDHGQCQHVYSDGRQCESHTFLEVHHRIPVSRGGPGTLDNLVTLCSAHHKHLHHKQVHSETKPILPVRDR